MGIRSFGKLKSSVTYMSTAKCVSSAVQEVLDYLSCYCIVLISGWVLAYVQHLSHCHLHDFGSAEDVMAPVAKAAIVLWEYCVGMTKPSFQPSLLIGTTNVTSVTNLCGLCWKMHKP